MRPSKQPTLSTLVAFVTAAAMLWLSVDAWLIPQQYPRIRPKQNTRIIADNTTIGMTVGDYYLEGHIGHLEPGHMRLGNLPVRLKQATFVQLRDLDLRLLTANPHTHKQAQTLIALTASKGRWQGRYIEANAEVLLEKLGEKPRTCDSMRINLDDGNWNCEP